MYVIIEKSNRKNKKYVAKIYKDIEMGNTKYKSVNFGDSRYQDYTMHKDAKRKELYLKRHQGENWDDPYKPAFWAKNLLWNKTTIKSSARDIAKKYNIIINDIRI
jgi:hypothetical protein